MKKWRKLVSQSTYHIVHIRKSEMMALGLENGEFEFRVIPRPPDKFIVILREKDVGEKGQ